MKVFPQLQRNYKDCRPEETIDKIKCVLKKCKIDIDRISWTKFMPGLFSLRIESADPYFGTNGKGRSRKYALASAYAEYMERIQNGLLILGRTMRKFLFDKVKSKAGFYYYPDEMDFSYEDFMKLPEDVIRELMNVQGSLNVEKMPELFVDSNGRQQTLIAVPFYNVCQDSVVYIPLNLLFSMTGSTGMAAGNTIEEAIYQGMCEIIERYAAAQVYFNRLTPPSIPNEYLRKYQKEYKLIETICSLGLHVDAKDFSCGQNLPAVGLIIYDGKKSRYRLNVGVDTNFQVALSRCLTEILQGYGSSQEWLDRFIPVPEAEFSYFFTDDEKSSRVRIKKFEDFTINGDGAFPYSLFQRNASYQFNDKSFCTQGNYKEEIKALKKIFDGLGGRLYIRDVSFLGFPSVYIYATNISFMTRKNTTHSINDYDMSVNSKMEDIDKIFNHKENYLKNDFIDRIVNLYSKNQSKVENARLEEVLRLEFSSNHILSKLPISYLFFLNRFHNKDYAEALRYFDISMNHLHVEDNPYFDGLREYVKAHAAGVNIEHSEYEEMKRKNILRNIDMPNCPHCNKCGLKSYCETSKSVNAQIRLINKMSKNTIEQGCLKKYFYYEKNNI